MTKVISISDEVYFELKAIKGEKESFTQLLNRLSFSSKNKGIMKFAGMWKSNKNAEKVYNKILKEREEINLREVKF
tara:strand:- start:939 stop:1166 length:228 start_codon:yes stop_codon:yes gene_type:complete